MADSPDPRISIVIPAYNAMRTIDLCLDSLLGQLDVVDRYEIVFVDDCSTDETAAHLDARIARLPPGSPRVRLIRQAQNRGPATARNVGAAAAQGEIVIFTDSDCELDPHWLREMTRPMDDPSIAAVKGAYRTRQQPLMARFAQAEFEERYRLLEAHEYIDVVFSYSAAIRKSIFDAVGGFDTSFPKADNEDTDLSWKIAGAGHRIKFAPAAIVYHRHPDTFSNYMRKKFSRAYWRACVYRRFPEKAVKDSYTPQGLKLQIVLAMLMVLLLPALLLWPLPALAALVVLAIVFLLTTRPFLAAVRDRRTDLMLSAPALIFIRALYMGAGLLWVLPRVLSADPLARKD